MKNLEFLIWMLSALPTTNTQFNRDVDDTCQSFIKAVTEAEDTMNQTRPQTYSDIAENIYEALNNVVVEVGLSALPLPQDAKSRARRSMIVIEQCRKDITLMYHNAVADAYVELRKAAGLPTELPSR